MAASIEQHTLQHTIRVLRTYPRLLSRRGQLPPFIHHHQRVNDVLPTALQTCQNTLKNIGHRQPPPREQLMKEMRIIKEAVSLTLTLHSQRDADPLQATAENAVDLVASTQAFVIYVIMCIFPDENSPQLVLNGEQLILDVSELSLRLASSGLALYEETSDRGQSAPSWHDWTIMSAKRRTILTIYILSWAWSVSRNYPAFYCHELQLMHAPSPRILWQAQTEKEWLPLYMEWLSRWKGNGYRIGELLSLLPEQALDKRTESWLE